MKLIIIEGGENVGKTTLVNKLKEKYGDRIHYAKFPSSELMDLYKNVVTMDDDSVTKTFDFIVDLITEEYEELKNKDIVLIDRFHLSTLVYQGTGEIDGIDGMILLNYGYLYEDLNITKNDVKTFILTKQYPVNTKEKRTEAQKQNDENAEKINEKYMKLIMNLDLYSDLGTYKVYSEKDYVVTPKYIYPAGIGYVVKNDNYIFDEVSYHIDECLIELNK